MNILMEYEKCLSKEEKKALELCRQLADDMGVNIYLVGGAVRDILLNKSFRDIDLIIECDALVFAKLLEKKHATCVKILTENDSFKTARVMFSIANKNLEIDIASTRSEKYEHPGALPTLVETSVDLESDIKRRDFTVNSLAISLNKTNFADVFDVTGNGLNDLRNEKIRVLHSESFIDDPSRIVRALRYRQKLDFSLDEGTLSLQKQCLDSKLFDDNCQERIKKEIKETLNILIPGCFDFFISENIYRLIMSKVNKKLVPSGSLLFDIIEDNINFISKDDLWLIFLCVLFNYAEETFVSINLEKLAFKRYERNIIEGFFELKSKQDKLLESNDKYSIYQFLKQFANESIIAYLCINTDVDISEKICLYLNKLKDVQLLVNGTDISKYGISEGEIYKTILNAVLKEKLNNSLNVAQEKQLFNSICEKAKSVQSKYGGESMSFNDIDVFYNI